MGPRAGLDGRKISPHQNQIPGPSSPQSFTIPTELPGPSRMIQRRVKWALRVTRPEEAHLHLLPIKSVWRYNSTHTGYTLMAWDLISCIIIVILIIWLLKMENFISYKPRRQDYRSVTCGAMQCGISLSSLGRKNALRRSNSFLRNVGQSLARNMAVFILRK